MICTALSPLSGMAVLLVTPLLGLLLLFSGYYYDNHSGIIEQLKEVNYGIVWS